MLLDQNSSREFCFQFSNLMTTGNTRGWQTFHIHEKGELIDILDLDFNLKRSIKAYTFTVLENYLIFHGSQDILIMDSSLREYTVPMQSAIKFSQNIDSLYKESENGIYVLTKDILYLITLSNYKASISKVKNSKPQWIGYYGFYWQNGGLMFKSNTGRLIKLESIKEVQKILSSSGSIDVIVTDKIIYLFNTISYRITMSIPLNSKYGDYCELFGDYIRIGSKVIDTRNGDVLLFIPDKQAYITMNKNMDGYIVWVNEELFS